MTTQAPSTIAYQVTKMPANDENQDPSLITVSPNVRIIENVYISRGLFGQHDRDNKPIGQARSRLCSLSFPLEPVTIVFNKIRLNGKLLAPKVLRVTLEFLPNPMVHAPFAPNDYIHYPIKRTPIGCYLGAPREAQKIVSCTLFDEVTIDEIYATTQILSNQVYG